MDTITGNERLSNDQIDRLCEQLLETVEHIAGIEYFAVDTDTAERIKDQFAELIRHAFDDYVDIG